MWEGLVSRFALPVFTVLGHSPSTLGVLSTYTVAELCMYPQSTCPLNFYSFFIVCVYWVYAHTSAPVQACGGQKRMLNILSHSLLILFLLEPGVVFSWLG